jgi:hypothetical protein
MRQSAELKIMSQSSAALALSAVNTVLLLGLILVALN